MDTKGCYAILTAVFVLSRALYYAVGVRFDIEPLEFFFQYIDPALLRTDLWRSLFYLEQQPPGFNFFLGTILQLAPNHAATVFHATYVLMGFALCVGLFTIMVRMGVDRRIALIIAGVFSVSPATILYENLLFYEYPLCVLFCMAALFLHRYATAGRAVDATLFFSCLALSAGIRSIFHLAWFGITVAWTLYAVGRWKWRTIVAFALPGILVFGFYLKNLAMFNSLFPGSSIYGGVNLSTMTRLQAPPDLLTPLMDSGEISPLFGFNGCDLTPAIRTNGNEIAKVVPPPESKGHPIIDNCVKSTGALNFNCGWLTEIGKLCRKDAMVILEKYPKYYANAVFINLRRYFRPTTEEWPFDGRPPGRNWQAVSPVLRIYNLLTAGEHPSITTRPWLSYFILPFLFGFGFLKIIRSVIAHPYDGQHLPDPRKATLVFMVGNIAYLSATVILLAAADQNRYRTEVAALFAVLLGLAITEGAHLASRKRNKEAAEQRRRAS